MSITHPSGSYLERVREYEGEFYYKEVAPTSVHVFDKFIGYGTHRQAYWILVYCRITSIVSDISAQCVTKQM